MGIKQRRERERQEVRQSILTAARQIAAEEGWQAVTTRKVAELIEYSQPTIYEYFANKEAILLALLRQGYEQLVAAVQVAFDSTADPQARLLAMTGAYWDFAFRSPELYQVMHGLAGAHLDQQQAEPPEEVRQSFRLAYQAVEEWATSQGIDPARIRDMVEARWGLIHGMITLTLVNRIVGGQEHVKTILLDSMRDLLFAWSQRRPA